MSRLKKSLIIGVSVLLLLAVGLAVLVHLLITPERVKEWALPMLEEHLQREVHLADVEIGLLSGIALQDLQIRDRDAQNNLLQIKALVLNYRFWPLLNRELIVDDIRLSEPKIRLVQNADGTTNIDDLLKGSEAHEASSVPAPEAETSGREFNLLVSRILLEDGDLLIVRGGADDVHLQNIRILVKNISLDQAFPLEVSARLNETDFRAEGELDHSASRGTLDLFVEQLDLNRFLPAETAEKKPQPQLQPQPKKQEAPAEEPGPIELPITLAGTVQIDELLYEKLTVKSVRAEYQLADNHFRLRPLSGNIAEGEFKLQTDVDLGQKGFAYSGDFALQGVDLQSLIPALMPQAKKSAHGLLQLQLDFAGAGTDLGRILDQLKSKGSFQLDQGKLMGSPILVGLAEFLGNSELEVLSFQSLIGEYELQQGLAQVKAVLNSSKTRLDSSGTVNLDGPLDLQLETKLSPEVLQGLSTDSPVGRAFTDEDGWGVLPLLIAGTYEDPKFSLSSKGLQDQAEEKAKEKVQEELDKRLGEEAAPAKDMLDKSFKKLFGD